MSKVKSKNSVLVVDDDPAVRQMLATCLRLEGYEVAEAGSGEEALTYTRSHAPEAVVLDVLLPGMDGYETCKSLRQHPKTSSTVIILLSCLQPVDALIQGLSVGADDFVTKPFEPSELSARLKAHLRRTAAQEEKEKTLERLTDKLTDTNKRLQEEASIDPLTGLLNRRRFMEKFESEYKRAKRFHRAFSFVLIDLDLFKEINDRFGHPAGDKALKEIALLLRHQLRNVDTIARYGGEEFAILLPETSLENAVTVIDRLRMECRELEVPPISKGEISLSAGLATFPDDGVSLDALYEKADRALYLAKTAGRNRVMASA